MCGFFEDGFPLLVLYQRLFWDVLKAKSSSLAEHVLSWDFPEAAWLSKWFLTLYIYSLPMEIVVRIIDYVIATGLFFLVKVGVQLMLTFHSHFLQMDMLDFDDFLKQVKDSPAILLDP